MKGIVLLSSGIDSPVAAYLINSKGVELLFLNLSLSKNLNKNVHELKNIISEDAQLVQKDFSPKLGEISKLNSKYTCLLCKRAMLKEAEKLAKKNSADFIVTGDNLGQVASQTLENLEVVDSAVDIPVLRPLLCMDKQEIIDIARKIGTYETSIKENKTCPFLPSAPVTKAKLNFVKKQENYLNI
ncbi:MAG: hypothetical protein ACQESF_03245 [Nanobdellota archaeon]